MAQSIEEKLAEQITILREQIKDLSSRAAKQTSSASESVEHAFHTTTDVVSDIATEARDQGQKAIQYTKDNPGIISVWAAVGVTAAIAYLLLQRR
ncbi:MULTISPECIES: hypothetical protein [unclassified Ochrobactrum]|uniref:hypothetical protein n=1 Tax=unclassified Ochrobactrum TaxID=239106 RepID=UPI0015FB5F7D|nr:ElaB/YqjD/DUF883 family membrane-anchored ribosome-binding protein [Ochrobactrum sp. RH2CCR150]MDH7787667.1 ElaB/YqjD/DUF883 family membrane-anchored ribosome-binding protein [Ochrobactrum sp. 19YEA23]